MTPDDLDSLRSESKKKQKQSLSTNTTSDSVLIVTKCNMRHNPVIFKVYIYPKTQSPQYVECCEAALGFIRTRLTN